MTIKQTIDVLNKIGKEHGYDLEVEARMYSFSLGYVPAEKVHNAEARVEPVWHLGQYEERTKCVLEVGDPTIKETLKSISDTMKGLR